MADPANLLFGPLEQSHSVQLARLALAEDLGDAGDITSRALVPESLKSEAHFVARAAGVLAGLDVVRIVLHEFDPELRWQPLYRDGQFLPANTAVARSAGRTRSLLAAERVALNFLQHLSGIATMVHHFTQAIAGLPCRIYDTRKTTPGWRVLEKYAVRAGGGYNHRHGLHDAILIKDNHLVAWRAQWPSGTLAHAIQRARQSVAADVVVGIEVDCIAQFQSAIRAGPDIVLLDNMSPDDLRQAVGLRKQLAPQVQLEASGGITLRTARQIAETGVDRLSIGAVTHSAPALDVALDFTEPRT